MKKISVVGGMLCAGLAGPWQTAAAVARAPSVVVFGDSFTDAGLGELQVGESLIERGASLGPLTPRQVVDMSVYFEGSFTNVGGTWINSYDEALGVDLESYAVGASRYLRPDVTDLGPPFGNLVIPPVLISGAEQGKESQVGNYLTALNKTGKPAADLAIFFAGGNDADDISTEITARLPNLSAPPPGLGEFNVTTFPEYAFALNEVLSANASDSLINLSQAEIRATALGLAGEAIFGEIIQTTKDDLSVGLLDSVKALAAAGVRKFAIFGVPPLEMFPIIAQDPIATELRVQLAGATVQGLNTALKAVSVVIPNIPELNAKSVYVDFGSVTAKAIAEFPQQLPCVDAYNLTACPFGPPTCTTKTSICTDITISQFAFFDAIHPTNAIHQIWAQNAVQGTRDILGIEDCSAFGSRRRRRRCRRRQRAAGLFGGRGR